MNKISLRCVVLAAALTVVASAPVGAQTTFHKFVAVGDSLIVGEESGCVVQRFQERSWVRIVATQLGETDFQQPLIEELPATNPLTGYPCLGPTFDGTSISVGIVSEAGANQNAALPRPYDNLGFNGSPHIKDFVDLKITVPGRSDLDNKAAAILRNCMGCPFEGMSAVDEANSLNPDLVAFWGGNNDALDAMGAGVAIEGVTLTPVDAFAEKYNEVMAALSASGRTVVAFNIPDIAAIPFATTIPPVVVNPATRQPVIVDGHVVPLLGPGDAAFPCDPAPPCGLPAGTLVTLSAFPLLAQGFGIPAELGGSGQPLPHGSFTPPAMLSLGVVLYPDDVAAIEEHTNGYNAAIATATAGNGVILVDANSLFNRIAASGFSIGGIEMTTAFLTGGLFSYDGVHPSAIGYGVLADEFIQTLNASTGSAIPRPNFSQIFFEPNVPNVGSSGGVRAETPGSPSGGSRTTRVVSRD